MKDLFFIIIIFGMYELVRFPVVWAYRKARGKPPSTNATPITPTRFVGVPGDGIPVVGTDPLIHLMLGFPNGSSAPLLIGPRVAFVKGCQFRQAALELLGEVDRFPVWLMREPQNTHDGNAIAVVTGQHQIGYVSRYLAEWLAPYVDRFGGRVMVLATTTRKHYKHESTIFANIIGPWPDELCEAHEDKKKRLSE